MKEKMKMNLETSFKLDDFEQRLFRGIFGNIIFKVNDEIPDGEIHFKTSDGVTHKIVNIGHESTGNKEEG